MIGLEKISATESLDSPTESNIKAFLRRLDNGSLDKTILHGDLSDEEFDQVSMLADNLRYNREYCENLGISYHPNKKIAFIVCYLALSI